MCYLPVIFWIDITFLQNIPFSKFYDFFRKSNNFRKILCFFLKHRKTQKSSKNKNHRKTIINDETTTTRKKIKKHRKFLRSDWSLFFLVSFIKIGCRNSARGGNISQKIFEITHTIKSQQSFFSFSEKIIFLFFLR